MIKFNEQTYNQFWLERLPWMATEKEDVYFTDEERKWALMQTGYKYFGFYEFTEQQKIAVAILEWCAEYINKLEG